jgi:hypothetical protein
LTPDSETPHVTRACVHLRMDGYSRRRSTDFEQTLLRRPGHLTRVNSFAIGPAVINTGNNNGGVLSTSPSGYVTAFGVAPLKLAAFLSHLIHR